MSLPSILEQIVEAKKIEVTKLYKSEQEIIKAGLNSNHHVISLAKALKQTSLAIIAEIKKGSPSAGIIREDFDPIQIAKVYQASGADAISCLTDEGYFYGSGENLRAIRPCLGIPILRKDFIIDPIQIYESRYWGADAFLLIVAILDRQILKDLYKLGKELGLEALIEVHNEDELALALELDTPIIGINNRNLHDFSVNLNLLSELKELIPKDKIIVGESGVKNLDDARYLQKSGADALLIGEGLIRATNTLSLQNLKKL